MLNLTLLRDNEPTLLRDKLDKSLINSWTPSLYKCDFLKWVLSRWPNLHVSTKTKKQKPFKKFSVRSQLLCKIPQPRKASLNHIAFQELACPDKLHQALSGVSNTTYIMVYPKLDLRRRKHASSINIPVTMIGRWKYWLHVAFATAAAEFLSKTIATTKLASTFV